MFGHRGGGAVRFAAVVAAQQTPPPKTSLKVGDEAPDFTLPETGGKQIKLSDFRGKKVVVLPVKPKEKTDVGVFIPEDAQHPSLYGTILALGPDVPNAYYEGQRVVYPQYAGVELMLDDGVQEVTVLIMDYHLLTAEIEENVAA